MTLRWFVAAGALAFSTAVVGSAEVFAQDHAAVVGFDSGRWSIASGRVVDFLGRSAFMGTATLKDVQFENGVIEFDVAASTDRARSYPGVTFRARPGGEWERFYIRPHRSALYGDVLQYVAAFNGVDSWQFYSGPGATAPATIPVNQWIHVRLEVAGSQARVFVGPAARPALVIPHLKHGQSRGGIGVMGPTDGTAYFSNFSYHADNNLAFDQPPPVDEVPGVIRDWQVSRVFDASSVDLEKLPEQQGLRDLSWTTMLAEPGGLVDISRIHGRSGAADVVFARTVITADRDETRKFDLGYSDIVTVFLNGRPVFSGNSEYQGRDSSFLGIAGWFDAVFLPLRKGPNDLTLAVAEVFGGWGFMVRDAKAVFVADGMSRAWATPRALSVPESATFDARRDCLYVSNYDPGNPSGAEGNQAISKIGLDGRIVDPRWVTGLANPTGLVVVGDALFAVERQSIARIDIAQAKVTARYPIPNAGLPNDIAAAPDGALYITDSQRATIFRLLAGTVEPWLEDPRIARPNGIVVDGARLIVGTNADGCLKSVDLATKAITTVVPLGTGIIDGLAALGGGEYLVSHNEGRLFRVSADGRAVKLLDTSVVGWPIADFAVARGLVIVPTFTDNRVMAYRLPVAR
jgi:sugar lactone lactonase YvrE